MSTMIDLRSDTVTKPSAEMRRIMAEAEVGDDVFGEDPSCNALEAKCAELLGKEAALFATSGTQGNLIATIVYGMQPFAEIVIGRDAHVMRLECGGICSLARASTYQITNAPDGTLPLEELEPILRRKSRMVHAEVSAVFLENTYGNGGGCVLPQSYVQQVRELCDRAPQRVSLHCDGARLWNAAIALDLPLHEVAAPYDSVQCCISKGLGAPVGSVLAGSAAFIEQARKVRKLLGGGMRQAGIVASAGLYAIEHNYLRLREDHENTKYIADSVIAEFGGNKEKVKVTNPGTNMCFLELADAHTRDQLVSGCKEEKVLIFPLAESSVRIMPNINTSRSDVERATLVIIRVLSRLL